MNTNCFALFPRRGAAAALLPPAGKHPARGFCLALAALMGLALAGPSRAQDLVWRSFDTDNGGFGCGDWGVTHTADFDPARDAKDDPNSGSLAVVVSFTAAGEATFQTCSGLADLSGYEAVSLDVYVDPGAPPAPNGTYGTLTIRLRPAWAWPGDVIPLGAITNTGWNHLRQPLPATVTGFSGLNLHWNAAFTTAAGLWLDNLTFIAKPQAMIWKGFDTDNGGFGCGDWGVTHTASWDGARDVQDDPNSGSLAVEGSFTSGGEVVLQTCSALSDLSPYSKVSLDVYVEPESPMDADNSYGTFTVRLRPGWNWPGDVVEYGAVTNTGWTHLERALPATASAFSGLDIHWKTSYQVTAKVWLDNLAFVPKTASAPPPALVLEKSGPGLEILTSGTGDYTRRNVATVADLAAGMSWVNASGPVTYAMSINESVDAAAAGFAANIMICGTDATTIGPFPDWHEPNGIFLEASPNRTGALNVSVRYKTNAVDSHGIRFETAGLLIQPTNITATSLLGTWALSLEGTRVSLSGPAGIAGAAELPADVLPLFAGNVFALFGAQPYTHKDRKISLSRVKISGPTGFPGAMDVDFTATDALDPQFLEIKEEEGGGVRLKPTNTLLRLAWKLPDQGFQLISTPGLRPAAWTATGLSAFTAGVNRFLFLTPANVTGAQGYFQLKQQ
jgi:hypothetical protein